MLPGAAVAKCLFVLSLMRMRTQLPAGAYRPQRVKRGTAKSGYSYTCGASSTGDAMPTRGSFLSPL